MKGGQNKMNNTQERRVIERRLVGLVAAVTLAGLSIYNMSTDNKKPFQMNGVDYNGYKNDKENSVQLAYFGDREAGVVVNDRKFDVDKAFHQCGAYNVSGYTQWGNTYATNIAPVKTDSPLTKVEAD